MPKVIVCCGVRPDVIKMSSVYKALHSKANITTLLCNSSQHDLMGKQMLDLFHMEPDFTMDTPQFKNRTLSWLTCYLLRGFTGYFLDEKPDLVLAHGDNLTGFASSLAAYYLQIPVGHVEAGLRTSRFELPNPEEGIRRMISRITTLHFAPTSGAARNLYEEGITHSTVHVTGNTVIDALHYILNKKLVTHFDTCPSIVVTCHRRENWGIPMINLCHSINNILMKHPNYKVFFPVHANPDVTLLVKNILGDNPKVTLASSTRYDVFLEKLNNATLIITDSGGVIEEAVALGKPVIVLRSEIERPEALQMVGVKLVANNFKELESTVINWLKTPPESEPINVFGDGTAGETIADIVEKFLRGNNGKQSYTP